MKKEIKGACFLFTETGTEGGYWAVQENGKRGYEGLQVLKWFRQLRTEGSLSMDSCAVPNSILDYLNMVR